MNRFAAMALSGMLASTLVLAGCAGQGTSTNTGEESTTSSSKEQTSTEQTSTVAGGWTAYAETTPAINDDVRAYWDKAMEGYTGVGFEPVRVLASQVVAGSNYAILARGTTVTATPSTDYYVVTMYVDPEGNASITSANKIDLADVKTADESVPSGSVAGGWSIPNPENSVLEPENARKAFDKAREAYVGAELYPIATLGTQVVSGTNYLVLCTSIPVAENPTNGLAVVKVYADLNGNAQVTDVAPFDLLAYVG